MIEALLIFLVNRLMLQQRFQDFVQSLFYKLGIYLFDMVEYNENKNTPSVIFVLQWF